MGRSVWLTIFLVGLAGLGLLGMGIVRQQQLFETRGVPAGMPPPIAYGGPQPGLNVYLEQYNEPELASQLEAIADSGIHVVKQSFYATQPYNWAVSDRLIGAVVAHDLELVVLLDGDPGRDFAPPADPQIFGNWAGQFAQRYGDKIDFYMIWDEPNLSSHWGHRPVNPDDYAALLASAGQAIRQADPNAVIVAAPLAPTTESGPQNLADHLYLQQLYEAGAGELFDVAAGKPYGFNDSPYERTVDPAVLNFSRLILLREVMERNGDTNKGLWAGNWGWNSLPAGWQGQPSIWGQVSQAEQARYSYEALQRARLEWPWLGLMFLENWQPAAPADNAHWGFAAANSPLIPAIQQFLNEGNVAYPGFHLAEMGPSWQQYQGGWRFSPQFGADISQTGDTATFHFWGNSVALRVRRADFRARLYVTIDGRPANALPNDGQGTALVLTAADPIEDYLATEIVARDLPAGEHTLTLTAYRGWEQWALNGFVVAYQPPTAGYRGQWLALAGLVAVSLVLAWHTFDPAGWQPIHHRLSQLTVKRQLALAGLLAWFVALMGWLTWGEQAAGVYRRLGDPAQVGLTAATASLFYVAPSFLLYLAALIALLALVYARPGLGLGLVALAIPFYVLPKPMLGYRFSAVEVYLWLTAAGVALAWLTGRAFPPFRPTKTDWAVLALLLAATLSLFFAGRQDVASNEWRVVMVEPALFYFLLRLARPTEKEMWLILDAFILGGVIVAGYGLVAYSLGENIITVEGGLGRLRSIYGSPNNVALFLGRVWPFLLAMGLMGSGRRRWLYGLALLPVGLAMGLTFSKGAFFLGIPAGAFLLLIIWRRTAQKPLWPWLVGLAGVGLLGLLAITQIPALSGRLNPQGVTSVLRLNLWQASLTMFQEHPLLGVGPDNFLYAYRGRYILDAAWEEPNLNHPHNIFLDFATRLGLLGLISGGLLWGLVIGAAVKLPGRVSAEWLAVAAGLLGALAHTLAHGLVDHSFFLVDLAYAFYLLAALSQWLKNNGQ